MPLVAAVVLAAPRAQHAVHANIAHMVAEHAAFAVRPIVPLLLTLRVLAEGAVCLGGLGRAAQALPSGEFLS